MENWIYYVVGVFVVAMIYLLALGGAAMVGGKFDTWTSRFVKRGRNIFRLRGKSIQRF